MNLSPYLPVPSSPHLFVLMAGPTFLWMIPKIYANTELPMPDPTADPVVFKTTPVANGYLSRLLTYKTTRPCQAATYGLHQRSVFKKLTC